MNGWEFIFGLIGASAIIGTAVWRLASKIERLSSNLEADQRMCTDRHDTLDADRASRSDWICKVEAKIDNHIDSHARGEC